MRAVREFVAFMMARKLYWMAPVIIVLALLSLLIYVAAQNSAVSPFIYMGI